MTNGHTTINGLIELDINLVWACSVTDILLFRSHLLFKFHSDIWILFNDLYLNLVLFFSLILLQILSSALIKETAERSSK